MVITNEITAKVFAPYIGQHIIIPAGYQFDGFKMFSEARLKLDGVKGRFVSFEGVSGFYPAVNFKLLLRPLSAITDEHAIEIAKIVGGNQSHINTWKALVWDIYDASKSWQGVSFMDVIKIHQYLQSKGYALPYLQYSVEDLVKAGIYQLTE